MGGCVGRAGRMRKAWTTIKENTCYKGFTLVELLVAVLVFLLAFAAFATFAGNTVLSYRTGVNQQEVFEESRMFMGRVVYTFENARISSVSPLMTEDGLRYEGTLRNSTWGVLGGKDESFSARLYWKVKDRQVELEVTRNGNTERILFPKNLANSAFDESLADSEWRNWVNAGTGVMDKRFPVREKDGIYIIVLPFRYGKVRNSDTDKFAEKVAVLRSAVNLSGSDTTVLRYALNDEKPIEIIRAEENDETNEFGPSIDIDGYKVRDFQYGWWDDRYYANQGREYDAVRKLHDDILAMDDDERVKFDQWILKRLAKYFEGKIEEEMLEYLSQAQFNKMKSGGEVYFKYGIDNNTYAIRIEPNSTWTQSLDPLFALGYKARFYVTGGDINGSDKLTMGTKNYADTYLFRSDKVVKNPGDWQVKMSFKMVDGKTTAVRVWINGLGDTYDSDKIVLDEE